MSDEGVKKPTRLSMWLQGSIFDLLLTLVVSVSLVFTISYGFYSAAELRGNILLECALCLLLLIAMFAGSWSKKALIGSICATVVVAAGIIGGFAAMMPADTPLFVDYGINDADGNYVIFALILVATTVVTYLLSRRTAGLFFLLIATVLCCGAIQFLYRDWLASQPGIPAFVIALIGVCMMFVFQTYRSSIYQAKRLKKPAFAKVFAFSALLAAVCVGIGCIVFFCIINVLGISTPNIKPFQDYYQRPVIEYTGVYTEQQVDNLDLKTSSLSDEWKDTKRQGEGGSNVNTPDENVSSDPLTGLSQSLQAFDANDWAEQFNTVGYNLLEPQVLIPIILALIAIVAFILFWRHRRVLRLRKWQELDAALEVMNIYEFLMKRFKRMRIKKSPNLTPLEYALASRKNLVPFSRNTGGVDLLQVTLIYQRAFYGESAISAEQVAAMERYYNAFFANARLYTGKVRWVFWRFWRI